MRLIISILTFCLFTAMVVPAMAEGYTLRQDAEQMQCKMDCCRTESGNKEKPHKGCCGDMACNPFMACSCCFACFFEKPATHKIFSRLDSERFPLFNSDIRTGKPEDCFHPPEIV